MNGLGLDVSLHNAVKDLWGMIRFPGLRDIAGPNTSSSITAQAVASCILGGWSHKGLVCASSQLCTGGVGGRLAHRWTLCHNPCLGSLYSATYCLNRLLAVMRPTQTYVGSPLTAVVVSMPLSIGSGSLQQGWQAGNILGQNALLARFFGKG